MKIQSMILTLCMSMWLLAACGSETLSNETTSSETTSSETTSGETTSGETTSSELHSDESNSSESPESSQSEAENSDPVVLYAVYGYTEIGYEINEYTYDNGGNMNADVFADGLSELTGLDFIITASQTDDGLIVDWDSNSTLIAGLNGREQNQEFFFYDHDSLSWFMMDSLWHTLSENLGTENIYYTMDGGKELTPKDLYPISSIPSDSPYMGSIFYHTHSDVQGDDGNTSENTQTAENYLGIWSCGRATLNISDNGDGTYQGEITWADSAFEDTEWVYILTFDADSQSMVCNNNAVKTYYEYKDEAPEPETTVMYTGGSGSFYLENGVITWYDAEEGCGEDMEFVK
ncbi:MAG: hypothetical protein ACI4KF_02010 [Huintestinicola sp.]